MFRPQNAIRPTVAALVTTILMAACGGSASATLTPTDGASSAATASPAPSSSIPASSSTPTPNASVAASLPPAPAPSEGSKAGQVRTDAFGIEQVWVPAGTFTMGTDTAAIAKLKAGGPPDWVVPALDAEA